MEEHLGGTGSHAVFDAAPSGAGPLLKQLSQPGGVQKIVRSSKAREKAQKS